MFNTADMPVTDSQSISKLFLGQLPFLSKVFETFSECKLIKPHKQNLRTRVEIPAAKAKSGLAENSTYVRRKKRNSEGILLMIFVS